MKNYADVTMQKGESIINFQFVFGFGSDMDIWEYTPNNYSNRKLVNDFDTRYHSLLEAGYVEI